MSSLDDLCDIPLLHHGFRAPHGMLHYVTAGNANGTPLVLFHGANMGIGQWFPNLKDLSRDFHIFAIDMYNAGESATLPIALQKPELYVLAAQKFVEEIVPKPALLVGHSLGGYLAARIALAAPEKVLGLVLVDAVGFGNRLPLRQNFLRVPGIAQMLLRGPLAPTERNIDDFIHHAFAPDFVARAEFVSYVLSHALLSPRERNPFSFAHMVVRHLHSMNLENELKKSTIPILMIVGEMDRMANVSRVQEAAARHPHIQCVVFPGVGHVPGVEDPRRFNETILEFAKTKTVQRS